MPEPSTPAATKAATQSRDPAPPRKSGAPPDELLGNGVRYDIGAGVARAVSVATYERKQGDPLYRPLRVYALDPATLSLEGATAVINVPYEPLAPGPKGCLFEVEEQEDHAPVDLDDPKLLITQGLSPSPSNYRFHQQMVYAVCSSVYATFRSALGRRIAWGFDAPGEGQAAKLKLKPHAAKEGANAAYDRTGGEIRFGYFPSASTAPKARTVPNGDVFTCLSHDIIVHELSHALIDGMRSHFLFPTGSDVFGFHEGFADTIAILQHFSYREVVESQIRKVHNRLEDAVLLLGLAESFGLALGKSGVLRSAVDGSEKQRYSPDLEAHDMGSVLCLAVFDAFRTIYRRKTERYMRLAANGAPADGHLPTDLIPILASEASKLASHFLGVCVRALDYCPPVDIKLGEFLRAMITADRDLVPDDRWAYREALIDSFAQRGIYPEGVTHMSEDALVWRPLPEKIPSIEKLGFAELKFARDPASPANRRELERQACLLGEVISKPANLEFFGLTGPRDPVAAGARLALPCVQSIRSSHRVGPDGQIVFDLIAEVTQSLSARDRMTGAITEFVGGSTVILGPNGDFRYVIVKRINNKRRLEAQLDYQRTTPFWERRNGRLMPCANPFKVVHETRNSRLV